CEEPQYTSQDTEVRTVDSIDTKTPDVDRSLLHGFLEILKIACHQGIKIFSHLLYIFIDLSNDCSVIPPCYFTKRRKFILHIKEYTNQNSTKFALGSLGSPDCY
ncbi:hypothetical protein, partial [Enterobacter hormaechei]|uniref:hypothetical protein n=1 Tax=Enterobacter hormaechei TaxID=158836 RepID=UPI0023E36EF9